MRSALTRKLSNVLDLSDLDARALDLLGWNSRKVAAHCDIVSDGDRPGKVQLILDGWACRYKLLPSGRRQISAILLPGDFCDLHVAALTAMDHGIAALSPVRVASVSGEQINNIRSDRPHVAMGFDWMSMVDAATLRAWIASLGQTTGLSRVAHLVCELFQRSSDIGLAGERTFPFFMSQIDIADATGMTPVHVNRVIAQLRTDGLVTITRKSVTIGDLARLTIAGNFDPAYLHQQRLVHS
jgi:CRP-like cAMP-binding protein